MLHKALSVKVAAMLLGIAALVGVAQTTTNTATTASKKTATKGAQANMAGTEKATFGAGCFWGVEAAFRKLPGVVNTRVGYAGGATKNPTYKEVCTDTTGHAEVVEVTYDPTKLKYEDLLNVFWTNHDPTQVNRQGPDVGAQYRTVIFYYTPEQEKVAQASKDELGKAGKFKRPIATSIEPASEFYEAEDYHQQYLEKRGLSSCHSGLQ